MAATLDLGVKQQRREQWNKAIADVKHDLGRPNEADANREFLNSLEQEYVASAEMKENLDSSPSRPHVPEWPASTGQERMTSKLPPQSIYTDNFRKEKHMVDRWTPKKLERVQLSIDALQLQFFLELHRRGWHEEAASAVPVWYAEHILQPVQNLKDIAAIKQQDLNDILRMKGKFSFGGEDEEAGQAVFATWQRSAGDVPLCSYNQDELGHFHQTAHELNSTLRELFDMGRNRVLKTPAVLAKVYHNLSVSSAPPNIDTYNTLIVGLSEIGPRRLVEDCIDSLQCAKLGHNEVSLASILNYWTSTGNQEEFQYWVQLMRGEWGGLALAQAGVSINESSQGRLFRKQEGRAKVIQRPSPSPMVFGALIKGVVKFSGFDAALAVCEAARGEGWGLCIGGLHHLLKDCSRRRDWNAGLATWKVIQALRDSGPKMLQPGTRERGERQSVAIDLPMFASMLQLCTRCNNRTAFQDIMEQAVLSHPSSARDLIRMVRAERSETKNIESKPTTRELTQSSDVSDWLETQGVHQHTDRLKGWRWQDIIELTAEGLKLNGVTSAAERQRLLDVFQQVRVVHCSKRAKLKSPWLWIARARRHRLWLLERRKKMQENTSRTEHNGIYWSKPDYDRVEPGEQQAVQLDGPDKPHARHDELDLNVEPLVEADEQDPQASYAIEEFPIVYQTHSTNQMYQPLL